MSSPATLSAKNTVQLSSHSLALAISLPTVALVTICVLICICCWKRKREPPPTPMLSLLTKEAKNARKAVRKLTEPESSAAPPMRLIAAVLQQLPSEQRRQKAKERRSKRRPAYMYRQDAEQQDEQRVPEQLPRTDSWVERASDDNVKGSDSGRGRIQLGIRYSRRHRFLTVALLQAADLQLPPVLTPPQQVQALLQILPSENSSIGVKGSSDIFQTPPAEFNSGQPSWRHAFRFGEFPDPLARWRLRVAVRVTADQEAGESAGRQLAHLGETWLDLAQFSPSSESQSPNTSSTPSTPNSSSSSATAPAESPVDLDSSRQQRRRRRKQQQEEAAMLELVFWQHLEPSWSCCGGY